MELIPITELDKQEICGWHYQGLYQIYNLPSYAEMKVSSMGFASPEKEKNFYVWRARKKKKIFMYGVRTAI